jgi:DNA-binding MarR family transcriptional regulator
LSTLSSGRPRARPPADGFLVGSLLQAPLAELGRRVQAAYAAAGFGDVRPAHHVIFSSLAPQGERVTDLAARVGTTKQAMGYLVDYLVERGYLERLPDPTDGRAHIVRRTKRGWGANRLAREVVAAAQAEWAAALGPDRFQHLLDVLAELAALLGVQYADSVSEVSTRAEPLQLSPTPGFRRGSAERSPASASSEPTPGPAPAAPPRQQRPRGRRR